MSANEFELVQRQDMVSFRDFDAARFADVHDVDAVSVFSSGVVSFGIGQIMASLRPHFTQADAAWTWTELTRRVYPERTAIVVYETTYVEASGSRRDAITAVAYTYRDGTWRAVLDQTTPLT